MSLFLVIPLFIRTAILFFLGAVVGGQLNRGIYRWAWRPRQIGPWSPPPEKAPPRRWWDRTPLLGWFFLARESQLHGRGYWIRPLLIELFTALGFAALYSWEMRGQLMPSSVGLDLQDLQVQGMLHAQFLSHVVLISLMIIATFIDFDEKTIPDAVTVPGTLAALVLAAWLPATQPPIAVFTPAGASVEALCVTSPNTSEYWEHGISGPNTWPSWLNDVEGLVIALAAYLGWCYAIWPKTWTTRHGLGKALQYLAASSVRHYGWWRVLAISILGSLAIGAVGRSPGPAWQSLFTSLVGLAFAGGLIWSVRIIAGGVLAKEAMGFGDVTLMAMIGAFLGWQSALMVFFLAPFAALFISVAQWILTSRKDIAFGPYLCLAAVFLVLRWTQIWEFWARQIFDLGWLIPAMVGLCLVLMAGMLSVWRLLSLGLGSLIGAELEEAPIVESQPVTDEDADAGPTAEGSTPTPEPNSTPDPPAGD